MTDDINRRNGHEIWVTCDGCGEGTTLRDGGGLYAERVDGDGWTLTVTPHRPDIGSVLGFGIVDVRCPDCSEADP